MWEYVKLELNWEVFTEFNENGEPNFYDSLSSTMQSSTGNTVKDLIIKERKDSQSQEKSKEAEFPVIRSSQPNKKFASLFCTLCSEDDFDYNLHAAGSLHATQTDINTDHNHELTIKWKEMTAKVEYSCLLNLLAQGDLASNEIYYHLHCYNDMVRNCEKLETDESIMDIKWKEAGIFDRIVSHILDAEAENPGSTSAAREFNLIHV